MIRQLWAMLSNIIFSHLNIYDIQFDYYALLNYFRIQNNHKMCALFLIALQKFCSAIYYLYSVFGWSFSFFLFVGMNAINFQGNAIADCIYVFRRNIENVIMFLYRQTIHSQFNVSQLGKKLKLYTHKKKRHSKLCAREMANIRTTSLMFNAKVIQIVFSRSKFPTDF